MPKGLFSYLSFWFACYQCMNGEPLSVWPFHRLAELEMVKVYVKLKLSKIISALLLWTFAFKIKRLIWKESWASQMSQYGLNHEQIVHFMLPFCHLTANLGLLVYKTFVTHLCIFSQFQLMKSYWQGGLIYLHPCSDVTDCCFGIFLPSSHNALVISCCCFP